RELLELAEAVELERVERGIRRIGFALVARENLRFGFHLELAQLFAQTAHGLLELDEVEAERRDLLLETRAVDRDFTRVVDERIEQVRAHADHFLRRARRELVFLDGRRRAACGFRRRGLRRLCGRRRSRGGRRGSSRRRRRLCDGFGGFGAAGACTGTTGISPETRPSNR